MERQFWAKRGRNESGPHATRKAAIEAFRAAFPVSENKARSGGQKVMSGYGNGGPWFDIRWHDALPRDGETIGD